MTDPLGKVAVIVAAALASALCTKAAGGQEGDGKLMLTQGDMTLDFHPTTGALEYIAFRGTKLSGAAADDPPFDIRLDDKWLARDLGRPVRLVKQGPASEQGLRLTYELAPFEVQIDHRIGPDVPELARRMVLTYRGTERAKLKGVCFLTPGVVCEGDGFYALPRRYPTHRRAFPDLSPGAVAGSGVGFAPVVAQLNEEQSLLWLTDGRVDRPNIRVHEREGHIVVEQHIDALAWLDPGDVQEIGTAYLTAVPGDYRDSLRAIWDWMDRRAIRLPEDRAEWMQDAVLYSFHPGGTIGSQFSDLGGFRAATEELLPTIPELGATAIWIMPIEDASVYHPRDYYKFQQGLGTADDYHALVDRAHGLGLKVLQDIVPHGGRSEYPRAREHPEWLVRDEEGNTLDYWCYDFNWPTWQEYMAKVADHYVREFDVDGYRVDAVYGSKIPNWNPDIPYERASMAQLQGGIGMLAGLRKTVKTLKPEQGALLAEVESAPHATVSDSQYDFGLCYTVLHGLRRERSPGEFVGYLQTYLEEQKYTNPPGTVLLRHIESHDSLRAQGWYGVEPMRALAALSTWIDGIPLIYHEMEVGQRDALRRIYEIRKLLPELRRGEASYLATTAEPEGVFTCLRRQSDLASIVAINLTPEAVRGRISVADEVSLPGGRRGIYDAMRGKWLVEPGRAAARKAIGDLRVELDPWGHTVLAIRSGEAGRELPVAEERAAAEQGPGPLQLPEIIETEGVVTVRRGDYVLRIDRRTGLPGGLDGPGGATLFGPCDLVVDGVTEAPDGVAKLSRQGTDTLEFDASAGEGGYRLTYAFREPSLFSVRCEMSIGRDYGALVLRVPEAKDWTVQTAEGLLTDQFRVRHRPDQPRNSSIYWRAQGTNVIWESRRVPLDPVAGRIGIGTLAKQGITLTVEEPLAAGLENVQLLDKLAGEEGLYAVFAWRDGEFGSLPTDGEPRSFTVTFAPDSLPVQPLAARLGEAQPGGGLRLRHTGTDWVLENEHYRLSLRRTGGAWRELMAKSDKGQARLVVDEFELYTDHGFGTDGLRYSQANDVECGVRAWQEGDTLRLRFWGQIRGAGRFDLTHPPVEYYIDYALTGGPSFRQTWGVRTHGQPAPGFCFLSAIARLPGQTGSRFVRDGEVLAEGALPDETVRAAETKRLAGQPTPDDVLVLSQGRRLLRFSDIRTTAPLGNVFLHGTQTFLAWLDADAPSWRPHRWYECSALVTPGDAGPVPIPPPPFLSSGATPRPPGLVDGTFEEAVSAARVSLVSGEVKGPTLGRSAWQMPASAVLTTEAAHEGRACVKIVNQTGGYDLIRQPVSLDDFPPGSRVRLSAWVKGVDIVVGDPAWKTGVLRLACRMPDGNTQYVSPPYFFGSFEWQPIEGVVEVPQETVSLQVEVGLNGCLGTLWIDDVRAERE